MLETIAVVLVILWLLGLVTSYTAGGVNSRPVGNRLCGDFDSRDSGSTCITKQSPPSWRYISVHCFVIGSAYVPYITHARMGKSHSPLRVESTK